MQHTIYTNPAGGVEYYTSPVLTSRDARYASLGQLPHAGSRPNPDILKAIYETGGEFGLFLADIEHVQ
jgi:hypothetical protein